MTSEFKSSFAENIFRHKYALTQAQTWREKARSIVEDVCGPVEGLDPLLSKDERHQLIEWLVEFKWIPGGRYVYYAGRNARFWSNCFRANTKVLTTEGWREVSEVGEGTVISPVDGLGYKAVFSSFGVQEVFRFTLGPLRGVATDPIETYATADHRWILANNTETTALKVGDVVKTSSVCIANSDLGFVHGFMYGDGALHKYDYVAKKPRTDAPITGIVRVCGKKEKHLPALTCVPHTLTYPNHAKGDPYVFYRQDVAWKNLPVGEDPAYVAAFIRGWIAADGCETSKCFTLSSTNKEALEWFREYAPFAGLIVTGKLRNQRRDISIGAYEYKDHMIYIQGYAYGNTHLGFKVLSKESVGVEEVFCATEPVHSQLILEKGLVTGNCFALAGREDTREEWGALANRAFSCLMVGGGIGVDYSVFRPAGRVLSRTGGVASGPIPLIRTLNEIGRNVCQGGSRRSAIFASLNWQHDDIEQFLVSKDWHNMPIGKNGYTVWDAKADDFNYNAPLDMTNISVGYDNAWLAEIEKGRLPDTYLKNVRQALMTGEPGLALNFGQQEKHTLRNACTEFVTDTDSDSCNLSSINLGAIDSLDELKEVVNLVSKFLICGSIRGHLPYKAAVDVRAENRRIGLGLMGMHEWLLKRNYPYEVVPELHDWLSVYRDESERSANEHCDRFYLARPKAYRAIAPTGTIAILAGTTSGIEPLFATAYKRRYLVESSHWRYEYVVDSVAELMVKQYGVDPDNIETAASMVADPERRIKFQYDTQKYVDMAISSTLNLPAWGSDGNNEDTVLPFAKTLAKYAHGLRGFTCYPDGSRGGQPITTVAYQEAMKHKGVIFEENSSCRDGVCGV